jgi:hypothetical protein
MAGVAGGGQGGEYPNYHQNGSPFRPDSPPDIQFDPIPPCDGQGGSGVGGPSGTGYPPNDGPSSSGSNQGGGDTFGGSGDSGGDYQDPVGPQGPDGTIISGGTSGLALPTRFPQTWDDVWDDFNQWVNNALYGSPKEPPPMGAGPYWNGQNWTPNPGRYYPDGFDNSGATTANGGAPPAVIIHFGSGGFFGPGIGGGTPTISAGWTW